MEKVLNKAQSGGIQYTVRGISPEVDAALRHRSASKQISLNQLLVDELTAAVTKPRKKIDLSDVAGKWIPDAEFDAIIADQRKIDFDKWK